MKRLIRFLSLGLIGTMTVTSLTGCNLNIMDDATKYPLVSALTTQEVVDFYAEALKYDSVITKNLDVQQTTYELKDVSDDKKSKLTDLQSKAETILGNMEYEYSKENAAIVSEDTFNYIKSYLNGNKLTNGEIKSVQGALGYYFVDVDYDVTSRSIGTFTQKTSLMGINGAFVQDPYDGIDKIDSTFLSTAVDKLNNYYAENKINKQASFDESSGVFTETETDGVIDDSAFVEDTGSETDTAGMTDEEIPQASMNDLLDDADESVADTEESEETSTADEETTEESGETTEDEIVDTTQGVSYTTMSSDDRVCKINVEEFNNVVGSSHKNAAYMPTLSEVYNIPSNEGTIGGIGIYPSGGNGLGLFGFDRSQISGTLTLRYVFKDTVDGSGDMIGVNIYPSKETINTGFTSADSNVMIPEFLRTEFEKLLERADRANIDFILPSLLGGNIYSDMGFAVLRGYEHNSVNLLKQMSTIRQVMARDSENNSYLLEVETTRIEGPKDVDCYGTYRDKSYVVIQQQGDKFIITDWMRMSRQTVDEPSINPDSATEKRLVALNLSGEVQDSQKKAIKSLLTDWYNSGTYRVLNGPKDVSYKGQTVTVEKGMYDCFNSDTTMLSSDDKEYMNSQVRTLLTKYGSDVNATFTGTVTEWIGGYDNQAEFTTEELISYDGRSTGEYMTVYYLVSSIEGDWVIDERTVLNKQTVEGNDLTDIQSRIAK